MTTNVERSTEEPPGLELAYDYIRDVLLLQGNIADALDSKAATLWAAATAVVGIGLPIAVGQADKVTEVLISLWIGAAGSFVVSTICFVVAYFPRRLETLRRPGLVRDDYWRLEPSKFRRDLALNIEKAFETNRGTLQLKGWLVRGLVAATVMETALVLVSVAVALTISVGFGGAAPAA